MKTYKVLKNEYLEKLEDEVCRMIESGYTPIGGIQVASISEGSPKSPRVFFLQSVYLSASKA